MPVQFFRLHSLKARNALVRVPPEEEEARQTGDEVTEDGGQIARQIGKGKSGIYCKGLNQHAAQGYR